MVTRNPHSYAGDVSAADAWKLLESDPHAQLVDCRTAAEWAFVGRPDLSPIGRMLHCIEWSSYPDMTPRKDFVGDVVSAVGSDPEAPIYFLCRSGVRSRAAAIAVASAGYHKCFNIAGGFEGDLDPDRHRGRLGGWKAAGLPWEQS